MEARSTPFVGAIAVGGLTQILFDDTAGGGGGGGGRACSCGSLRFGNPAGRAGFRVYWINVRDPFLLFLIFKNG